MKTTRVVGGMLALASALLAPSQSDAESWPCFRGPNHDGVSTETDWTHDWPTSGPSIAWSAQVGTGYSSVVIDAGRLVTMGNEENVDTVHCLDAATGETVWQHSYSSPTDPNEFSGGPTSTPTIHDGRVYTLSRTGEAFCFDAATGEVQWSVNVAVEAQVRVPGWGFSGAPWVDDRLVVLNVGDAGVGLDRATGKVLWASADKDAGYSSFVPSQHGETPTLVFGSARSYVCINPETGAELWRQRWLTTFGCNAADPIVLKNQVFLSSGYNRGSALLETGDDSPAVVWKHKEFQNQISTSVKVGDYLYGASGDIAQGAKLTCMNFLTGDIAWIEPSIHVGGLLASGERLIVLSDEGELLVVAASAESPDLLARHAVLSGQSWTAPVLSDQRLFCRASDGQLVCLDLSESK
ncbi:MAG: PQQ-binding-like beta-propeller repeat protein [Rubripirellula sp.]